MKKISFLIIMSVIFLVGCSKETIEEIKTEKDGIRGIVRVIEDETFTMDSRDRIKQGQIIITKRVENKNGKADFDVGDTITVYYEKIEDGKPARINRVHAIEVNKKAEPQDLIENEKGEMGIDDVDYYEFPNLTVIRDGQSVELTSKSSALVHNVINTVEWDDNAIENFEHDFVVMDGVEEVVTFNSKTGTLNDEKNNLSVVLYKGIAEILKETLEL